MTQPIWRLAIDTGGTFTDCLAVDPQGRTRRVKVLSSGAVRTRIAEVLGRRVRLQARWQLPDGFFAGAALRVLDGAAGTIPVEGFQSADGLLSLAADVTGRLRPGSRCELQAELQAPLLAAHLVTETPLRDRLPPLDMRLASTRGTNALLERHGAPTALFISRGFGDLLVIGDQRRPELFALEIERPDPLYAAVVEVAGRLAADGTELEPIDRDRLRSDAATLIEGGIRIAAVALLHSWRNPDHELAVAALLEETGFEHVSRSANLAPLIKLLPRAETAVVDATLTPTVGRFLDRTAIGIGAGDLHVMTSAGGLVRAADLHPKDTLLSGPAGGVVGAVAAGRRSGFDRLIAFDMGGTSTDVSRCDGELEYLFEHRVGPARLMAPALAIETVAAGGGSVCSFDGHRVRVGPESASAAPGPACYGAGGPLTLTDLNLVLGRIDTEGFHIPIDAEASHAALDGLRDAIKDAEVAVGATEALAEGLLRIADERTAAAIRRISLRRGYDPTTYPLLAFGGAGPQHGCAVAELLGITTVVVPPDAGLLSAGGVAAAVVERFAERQILALLDDLVDDVPRHFSELGEAARRAVADEGVALENIEIRRLIARLRLRGQDSVLAVDWRPGSDLRQLFGRRYREVYGYEPPPRPVEVESLRAAASTRRLPEAAGPSVDGFRAATADRQRSAFFDGRWREVPVFGRRELASGDRLGGPALVVEAHSVTVVAPGWQAEVDGGGALILSRDPVEAARPHRSPAAAEASTAVEIELFSHRLSAIALDMGELLQRTALSVNVKERLDFSCAVLDAEGFLVVNAPHIPVHLGALGICVRRLFEEIEFDPGDVVVTNHPGYGGSHLPDVTTVTPVFHDGRRIGFVANRAHHAEIGGRRPGSVPPDATSLAEEGVVIPPTKLLRRGVPQWPAMRQLLEGGSYPTRSVDDNLCDLEAAVAANRLGDRELSALAASHGADAVARHIAGLRARAARIVGAALSELPDGRHVATERLDDGSPLRVTVEIEGPRAHIDFTGSADVHPGNLNATPAVVQGAVLYVLRLLAAEPLPLNEGLMEAVELTIPHGILNPEFPVDPTLAPAVVGGNVETSQRLVDVLLKALRLSACSQGTMNNLVFGDESFGYYETVAGGTGAGPSWAGADAVHSHMTNTRATDPEILEQRYPVRLERFAVRRGSGGTGRHRGGDGAVREVTFLRSLELSLLSQHRHESPYGMAGGGPGQPGRQRLLRADGTVDELAGIDGRRVEAGDRLVLETPGGGGWGEPEE